MANAPKFDIGWSCALQRSQTLLRGILLGRGRKGAKEKDG